MIERPGIMTNIFYSHVPGECGTVHSMEKTRAVGFDVMDLNMCPMQRNDSELCEDDNWERYTDQIGEAAAKLGITFAQSHPPYPKSIGRRKSAADEGCEYNEFFRKMQKRAIEIDCRLGIRWAVLHPVAVNEYDTDLNAAYNYEVYGPMFEKAAARGVGFAFENMADLDAKRRFGVTPEDLLAILDKFGNSPDVGVCWDTGHANRVMSEQAGPLRQIGEKLVCTHIDDNIGQTDLHTIPYFGTIGWESVMKTLREIDYKGAFIYELAVCKRMPAELRTPAMKFIYEVGRHLVSIR